MIKDQLKQKMIAAMKEKDTKLLSLVRFLMSAINNMEIELRGSGGEYTDEHTARVFKKQIKMRKQSIEGAQQAGREDIIEKETYELEAIKSLAEEFGIDVEPKVPPQFQK